jgi:AbrB family looped-hinge helix DNA binding protein
MKTTRLSSKGQVILPKAVRDLHRWEPGTDFTVEDIGDGVVLRPVKKSRVTRLADVAGCLKYEGPARTVEEMNAAVEAGARAGHARGRY